VIEKLNKLENQFENWLYEKPLRVLVISALSALILVGFVWVLKIITLFA